jgi:predicted DNA-binding transcriptional regulator YafY
MRAARLLSIQMMLETRGQMSARELADVLEISVRTLHRDVDHLSAAGVPVVAERGRSGGFRLLDGWSTRLTGLTPSEAQAVFLSGLAGPAAELGLREALQNAQLKLLVSLPASWRDEAKRLQSRLHLDPVDWYKAPDPVPRLATVADAVWNERQLRFRYQSWKRTSERTASPLGLVLKAGIWYFLAQADGDFRIFRVAGVLSADVLSTCVRRPKGFDLARQWQTSMALFEQSIYTTVAQVLATPAGLEALRQLNAAASRAVDVAVPPSGFQSRTRVRLPIESIEAAAGQLLAFAPDVEVEKPRSLRQSIARRSLAISRLYANDRVDSRGARGDGLPRRQQ